MQIRTLKEILESLNIPGVTVPVAYQRFRQAVDPPFIAFEFAYTNNFDADDTVYRVRPRYSVFLYTAYKDPLIEDALEALFLQNHIIWDKTEIFLADEELTQIIYTIYER